MPGIFGIIPKDKNNLEALRPQFERMARLLKHFDYYDIERYENDDFILGRIGIPYRNYHSIRIDNDSGNGVVFDGYIYGWHGPVRLDNPHLREPVSLIPLGNAGNLRDIPLSINGSFTMALFEKNSSTVYLATDKLGFRQLYYYEDDKVFAFAPEIKAFLGLDSFRPRIDNEAVSDFFNYCFIIGGRTLYGDVSHLYPATIIEINQGRAGFPFRYWNCSFSNELDGNPDTFMRQMLQTAHDTFERQMGQQDNFIMALSGGMDSRVVAYLASNTNRKYYYYSHGTPKSEDALIAGQVAETLRLGNCYAHKSGSPISYAKHGAWTTWLVDGMVSLSCSPLTGVLNSYNLDPLRFEFQNSIYTGAMNFAGAYGKESDIVPDLSQEQKINRIKQIWDSQYFDEQYYNYFKPEYRELFIKAYHPHIISEFQKYEKHAGYFVNELDAFHLETRILRLSNQYDLNRFFYHDHFSLIDDISFNLYLDMPMNFKVDRKLYKEMYCKLLPDMAKIVYQKTGVDLYGEPSERSMQMRARKDLMRYYLGRLSYGNINLYNYHNYTQPDQWYRKYPANKKFFENILLDPRTLNRGYFNGEAVNTLLKKQAHGSNSFSVISSLATFELFNRYFIDRDDPPKYER
jgi:hypothetical protein